MRKVGLGLLVVSTIAHAVAYLVAAPKHVVDPSWPPHARFHVLQALIWIVGLNGLVLSLVARLARRDESWTWWALLGAWPIVHGAYFAAFLAGGPPPAIGTHVVLGVVALAFGAGLAFTRPRATSTI